MAAMAELLESPTRRGVRDRADIFPGLKFYHIARRDQRGRHFILFRVLEVKGESLIEVLRVLHDSMDFERHLPTRPDENEPQG